jgi:DNA-directed RNA polymerase subunit N (RpoN/RPB10)
VRGEFEALVTERVFFRVQAILDGRYEVAAPRQRNDPDFPLRGYIRCETCGKPLTASWSVYFPDGVRFDGQRLVGTGTTLPVFKYLNPISDEKKELVDQTGIEPVTS